MRFGSSHLLRIGCRALTILLLTLFGCRDVTRQELVEDIRFYEGCISEVHADPYRILKKELFKDNVERTIQEILESDEDKLSSLDSFFYLQKLAASLQDGHTRVYPPSEFFSAKDDVFPLQLKRWGGAVYVVDRHPSAAIPEYASILEVNQIPIDTLFADCSPLFPTSLEHAKWSYFEDYFHLLIAKYLKLPPPWKVAYRHGSTVETTVLRPVPPEEFGHSADHSDIKYSQYSIRIENEDVPVLSLPDFRYGGTEGYMRFIDSFFQRNAESDYLIIDIRENRGGSGYRGFYLLDYLTTSEFQIARSFQFKVSETMRNSIYAAKAGNNLLGAKNGEYIEAVDHRVRTPKQTPKKFQGKAFLLISEKTFSAGVVFAAIFKANSLGIVVGRETAGRECFGSDPVTLKLPNSGLRFSIPVAVYALPGDHPDRGVVPDIVVSQTMDDHRLGNDVDMEKIGDLIQEDMNNRSAL